MPWEFRKKNWNSEPVRARHFEVHFKEISFGQNLFSANSREAFLAGVRKGGERPLGCSVRVPEISVNIHFTPFRAAAATIPRRIERISTTPSLAFCAEISVKWPTLSLSLSPQSSIEESWEKGTEFLNVGMAEPEWNNNEVGQEERGSLSPRKGEMSPPPSFSLCNVFVSAQVPLLILYWYLYIQSQFERRTPIN